jgi:hypothetical protein
LLLVRELALRVPKTARQKAGEKGLVPSFG